MRAKESIAHSKKEKSNKTGWLIALCWLVYATSYIGKLSYNANINQIGQAFDVSYGDAGLVSTFFFCTYGIGQIINGLLCKRYNIKYVIFGSLIVSSAMNCLVVLVNDFAYIKYFWLINGASMSFLWTSLIRLLSEKLDKKDLNKATVVMGTTVATGTLLVYGISALFAATIGYKWTFILAAALMVSVAVIWLACYNSFTVSTYKKESEILSTTEKPTSSKAIIPFIVIMALFAISNNFTKDGLTAWTPDIISSIYETEGWLSILLTVILPLFAIMGTVVAVKINGKTKDFVLTCTILFGVSVCLMTVVTVLLNYKVLPLTLICFALVSCFMAGVNNVITSMVPLQMRDKIESGKLAGILNGFCYLGSTVSTFGLGVIADKFEWIAVFYTLIAVGVFAVLVGVTYKIALIIKKR